MTHFSDMQPQGIVDKASNAGFRRPRPQFRLANPVDLPETYHIYVAANEHLNRSLGRHADLEKHTLPARALAVRSNALRCDAERFWVAHFGDEIAGFGLATRRRTLWYLAALHVLPQFQGQGIGNELVRHCLGGLAAGDSPTLLTTSDSANPASTGMYLRFGLLPQTSIIQLEGRPRSLGSQTIVLRPAIRPAIADYFDHVDRIVLGEIRPEDHECWATVPGMIPYLACENDHPVGYIYIDRDGAIGPAAVERPEVLPPTITAALLRYAADQSNPVQLRVPADARETLGALFSSGINCVTEVRLLLTSRHFGLFDRYLFSGADALF
jgi:ribosomal protein S18 acetylase RimI-like enzyme